MPFPFPQALTQVSAVELYLCFLPTMLMCAGCIAIATLRRARKEARRKKFVKQVERRING